MRKTQVILILLSAAVLTACSQGVTTEKPQKTDISDSSSSVTDTEDGFYTADKTNENVTVGTGNLNVADADGSWNSEDVDTTVGSDRITDLDKDEKPEENSSEYIFMCVDEDDMPVTGVTLQICTDETCFLAKSDENGVIEYAGEPFEYEIHVYRYDDGYEPVTDAGFTTSKEYGTYEIRFRHRDAVD